MERDNASADAECAWCQHPPVRCSLKPLSADTTARALPPGGVVLSLRCNAFGSGGAVEARVVDTQGTLPPLTTASSPLALSLPFVSGQCIPHPGALPADGGNSTESALLGAAADALAAIEPHCGDAPP